MTPSARWRATGAPAAPVGQCMSGRLAGSDACGGVPHTAAGAAAAMQTTAAVSAAALREPLFKRPVMLRRQPADVFV